MGSEVKAAWGVLPKMLLWSINYGAIPAAWHLGSS